MRFEIVHRFEGARLEDVEELYLLDDEFNREVFAALGYERGVHMRQRDGDRLRRVLRVVANDVLPAPFSSLVRASGFHFDEHTDYDFASHRGTWKTVPSVLADQFASSGTFSITAAADAVVFRMEGETTARLPLIGRRAEKQAVATAEKNHRAIADAVRARLTHDAFAARSA